MRRRILKIAGYTLLTILVLICILAIAIQVPKVQNYIADKVLANISEQYDAEWNIGSIKIDFMDEIIIKDILFKDQKGDTLLAAESLIVDIGLINLFNREIRLDQVDLSSAYSHIYDEEGVMNFDFLLPKKDTADTAIKESKPWDISIGKVNIFNPIIDIDTESQSINVRMNSLSTQFTKTDFNKKILELSILDISEMKLKILSQEGNKSSSEFVFPNLGWDIFTSHIEIAKSDIDYVSNMDTINISEFDIIANNLSVNNEAIGVEITDAGLVYNENITLSKLHSSFNLKDELLTINDLQLETNNDIILIGSAEYNINTNVVKGNGLDVNVEYQTLAQLKKYLPARLNPAPGAGINLKSSYFSYQNEEINVKNLNASYGNIINAKGDFLIKTSNKENIYLDSNIDRLQIDLQRAGKLWDGLSIPDSLKQFKKLTIVGNVEGRLDALKINNATLQIDDVLDFKATGTLSNISEPSLFSFDVMVAKLSADISKLPVPENDKIAIDSLGFVNFSGQLSGNAKDIKILGDLDSRLGSLSADLRLTIPQNIDDLKYNGTLSLNNFDIGTLLKNDKLDRLTIRTELDGQGLNFDNLNTKVKGVISDFVYNDYTYADINLNAEISDRTVNGTIKINDKNAKLSYDGVIRFDTSSTILDFKAGIDTINLKALGFMSNQLSISGDIDSELRLPLRRGETGRVDITNLILDNGEDTFYEDSIGIRANKTDSTFVTMNSQFADLSLKGQFGIRDLPVSIGEMVDYYINLDTSFVHFENSSKSLAMKGQIRTLAPVNIIMPQIMLQSGVIDMDATLDFVTNKVNGEISFDSFFVSTFFSEKLAVSFDSKSNELNANIRGENNTISSTNIPILNIQNVLENDKIKTIFEAKDTDLLPRLRFVINTDFKDGYTEFIMSDSLILNKKDWLVSNENSIRLYPDKIIVENFALTDNNEYLKVNSTDDEGNGLNINFKNFNIGQFTTLLTSEPSKLTGNIDGDIDLLDMRDDFYYLINLKVDDMVYDSTAVGVLTVNADENQSTKILTTDISLVGPANDVSGGGTFNPVTNALDFDLDINAFQMMLIDPFISTILTDSEGNLTGKIKVDGTSKQPLIDGKINLENVITRVVVNNTRYGLEKQTITFDNNTIDIGTIDIFDIKNNTATVSGKIYHSFLQDIELDLNLQTDAFTFLNTSKADNPVFYGKVILGADVDLTGPIELLDVQAVANTLDSTNITISPFSAEQFLLEEDFITYGKPSDFEDLTNEYLLKLARQFPFKVNIILNATQEAKMNFVVDPVTGDKIVGKGNGNLRIKLNPDGQQEIFGTYTIVDGEYTFSYGDFVSKDFKVKPGGTVKFNGNPLNAILDIDAIYSVYTTTYELIKNEISANTNEVSSAQRRTNVDVYLAMKGTLDNPAISLDIKVPDLESATLVSTVERKLNELRANPNELNNQVFGLLIFNSFILSDNMASGFGNIGSNIALSSVSSLISSQLNKLADKVVKGVNVDINVNSYDSDYVNDGAGGNVTEVGLKVSKQLFNDRLSISAGGNFDLSAENSTEPYSSIIGDFVLEYKLTENGRYRIRVFSKSDYDRLLNENTSKNGVSLFFNRSFDSKLDD